MNKKQIILSLSSMLSIATLILAETTEEKCLRKLIYENRVELTVKNKPIAIKIINNHVERCKKRLDSKQRYERIRFPFINLVGTFLMAVAVCGCFSGVQSSWVVLPAGGILLLSAPLVEQERCESIQELRKNLKRDNRVLEKLNSIQ